MGHRVCGLVGQSLGCRAGLDTNRDLCRLDGRENVAINLSTGVVRYVMYLAGIIGFWLICRFICRYICMAGSHRKLGHVFMSPCLAMYVMFNDIGQDQKSRYIQQTPMLTCKKLRGQE